MRLSWKREQVMDLLRRYGALLLVLTLGLGLLLWPEGEREPEQQEQTGTDAQYVAQLEQRLAQTLSQIDGVGRASVVLTWETGGRRELAADERGEERETVVVSGGTGRQETVVVQESAPRLLGALVVCPGGGEAEVRWTILHAVMALTGLRANQISICQGGRSE